MKEASKAALVASSVAWKVSRTIALLRRRGSPTGAGALVLVLRVTHRAPSQVLGGPAVSGAIGEAASPSALNRRNRSAFTASSCRALRWQVGTPGLSSRKPQNNSASNCFGAVGSKTVSAASPRTVETEPAASKIREVRLRFLHKSPQRARFFG